MAHTPCDSVILDTEHYACMPDSETVVIVGRKTHNKVGMTLKNRMLQFSRAQRAGKIASGENPGYQSSRPLTLSVFEFQNGRDAEKEPDATVEQLLFGEPEIFMAPDDELRECRALLTRWWERVGEH